MPVLREPTREEYTTSDPQAFWSTFVLPRLIRIEGISSRDETGVIMRARQTLDDELAAMHLVMCSLRTRRNALSPVSSLPAEVLARIFEFYAALQPPASDDERPLGWIELTHVCRLWRDTAMQFPSLWSDICFDLGPQWAEAMLARTKEAPVSLRRRLAWAPDRSMNLISEHMRHTRELSLVGPLDVLERYIRTLPSPPRTLEIMELGTDYSDFLITKVVNFKLPEAMVGCHLPSLHRLALKGFWVPWSAPILSGLTHLEIRLYKAGRPETDEYLNSSHQTLFDTLKAMPNLEKLVLAYCFPLGPWKDGGSDILQLSRMRVLYLSGPSEACFGIAKRLRIPASCQVQLRCNSDTDIAEIFPFLAAHINNGTGLSPWETLLITALNNEVCRIQMWHAYDVLKDEDDKFDPGLSPELSISFCNSEQTLHPLKALCQALPLQTIRTVYAFICLNFSNRDWIDVLGQCTNVEKAYVSGHQSVPFCRALCKTTDHRPVAKVENCPQEKLFLSKLEFLQLENVDFRPWWNDNRRGVPQWLFTKWLKDRLRVKGAPMLRVDLQKCSIKANWVGRLRMVAAFVRWDEFEGECAEDSEPEEDSWDAPNIYW